ncbi:MAG: DUF4363 family protein [Oscillospiraceae bacterium]|nr:DUF4363 family protein [Oscillospiraceae bacterium]
MKRLWIAIAILLAIFSASIWNARFLAGFLSDLNELLVQAETSAESGRWEEALQLTSQAQERWKSHDAYLHTVLRHADLDQVDTSFGEVQEFLQCQEQGEYSASNAKLMTQLMLIWEAEQLTLQNIL